MNKRIQKFQTVVRKYYRTHGRHDLPFRPPSLKLRKGTKNPDPYRILVSEVMLQQTQVSRVVEFYPRFLKKFPNFRALARASVRDVLAAWSGLGYNRRALYLKRTAERVVGEFNGKLPRDPAILRTFPGIGPNTAGSLAAFAFNAPVIFIETNIRRTFLHHFFPGQTRVADAQLLPLIEATLDRANPREWYYALMDYGVMLGETLRQVEGELTNPNRRSRHYVKQSKFEGSERQVRGNILRALLAEKKLTDAVILRRSGDARAGRVLKRLVSEGFVQRIGASYRLAD